MISRQERVQRGAALLDKVMPGWARRIKLRRLNMGFGYFSVEGAMCGCIGAQLDATQEQEGNWSRTMQRLDILSSDYLIQARYGFTAYPAERVHVGYDQLTELWKDEVRARR